MTGVWRPYVALWHWLRGHRVGVGRGDVAIGHARERTPALLALAGVLALETAVVGVLVPWPIVHVLDVVALLQVLGIAAVEVTHPHVLRREELVLREGARFALRVPLGAVVSVRVEHRSHTGPARQLAGAEVAIVVANQTDVLVTLSEPVPVLGGEATRIRFRADDPRAAVSAIAAAAPTRA